MLQSKTKRVSYRIVLGVIVGAVVLSLAHAAEHGLGPHEHDGVVCVWAMGDDEAITCASSSPLASPAPRDATRAPMDVGVWLAPPPGLRPPKTGPPRA